MLDLIPASWRQALADLREAVHDTLERWFHGDHTAPEPRSGELVVRPTPGVTTPPSFPAPFTARGPVIDVDETDDDVVVTAELPGLERDDFTVEITGGRLVIRGEKKQSTERSAHGYTYSERRYGAFARALQLPCEVDSDKAEAHYQNGVLRLTLPKTEQAKSTRITVKVHR
jgi:HSP20 family protein